MSGWVKLHRRFLENGHFQMPDRALKIWLYILLTVSHRDIPSADLNAGEAWISYDQIARDCGEGGRRMRREAVARSLRWLEEHGYIERFVVRGRGQKVRVPNWHKYQGRETSSSDTEPAQEHGNRSSSGSELSQQESSSVSELAVCPSSAASSAASSVSEPTGAGVSSVSEPKQEVIEEEQERQTPLNPPIAGERRTVASVTSVVSSGDDLADVMGTPEWQSVTSAYQARIGVMGPLQAQRLAYWLKRVEAGVVVAAIDEAADIAHRTGDFRRRRMNYIDGILRNWSNDGVRTVEDLRARNRSDPRSKEYDPLAIIRAKMAEWERHGGAYSDQGTGRASTRSIV